MTTSALTRLNRLPGFPAAGTGHDSEQAGRAHGTASPCALTPADPTQHILSVEFVSPGGRPWRAIGGGNTRVAAIAFARDSCPAGTTWQAIRWNDLYGH